MARPASEYRVTAPLPASIEDTLKLLGGAGYVADRPLATVVFLALKMQRPLFLEGEAGVGKTEIANVLAKALRRGLIRLQCYEGVDEARALYEWNHAKQILFKINEIPGVVRSETMISLEESINDKERLFKSIFA